MSNAKNKINPIRITDTEAGDTYVLEFSRESVRFAESRGLKIAELLDFPQTYVPLLWFCAFRKNHKDVARDKTDKLLEDLGGLKVAELDRLVQLYQQPTESLLLTGEMERKNARMTVEM